jgi:protein-S-isoprenylcysteine O-methyltransferase Ste14
MAPEKAIKTHLSSQKGYSNMSAERKTAEQAEAPQDKPSVIMLPPVLMVLHITPGLALNWIFAGSMHHAWGWLGLLLIGAAMFLVQWSKQVFEEAGTPVPPNMPTTAIVTTGPYQYSRNPMYVNFLLWFAGLALLAGAPLMLFMLVPFWYILDRHVIVPEENYLGEKFGATYLDYKAKVRRWV